MVYNCVLVVVMFVICIFLSEILVGIPDKIQTNLLDNFSLKLDDDTKNKRYYHVGR